MKKTFYFAAAALVALAAGACSDKGSCTKDSARGDLKEVFTGVLPAADAEGIRYTLNLDYDDDNNYTDGDYALVETYLVTNTDSVSKLSYNDSVSYKSKGDFNVVEKNGNKYLQLVPDRKYPNASALNLMVNNDSTLTLVGSNLEPAEPSALNYTLKLVK